ncbi:MAG: response regulator [Treponema sp.]|nr:response regulator [Treponema sp.]
MTTGQKTIFLVDDDITNLTMGNDTLSKFYNVFTFDSGRRLMKMLEKHIPDLILLDVEMPEMNGYEVIRLLKNAGKTINIPVIFLTSHSDMENELKGLSLGAVDYIIKPFSPPLLLKRIEIHLLVDAQKRELINFNNNLQGMVEEKTRTVVELKNAVLKTMAELVDCRDDITGGHIERTQYYLSILLDALKSDGLYAEETSTWDMDFILQSAQLHDVGKIAISDNILKKQGRLTGEEFEEIKLHVTFGEMIIEKIKENTTEHIFLDQAKTLVSTHHEKWNGTGYPRGLKGKEIPLLGRLMAIADVYDALVSERPYKKPISHEQAVNIISTDNGIFFDPSLIGIFLGVSDKFYNVTVQGESGSPEKDKSAFQRYFR